MVGSATSSCFMSCLDFVGLRSGSLSYELRQTGSSLSNKALRRVSVLLCECE